MRKSIVSVPVLSLLLVWLLMGASPGWSNPLTAGRTAPEESAISLSVLPEPLRGAVQGLNRMQIDLSRAMNRQLQEIRDQGSLTAGLWLCLIGFVYGVLHAAGPGHGKVAVSSYFLGNRARISRGLMLSAGAAATQAAAALLLVGIPVLLLDMSRTAAMGQIRYLELGSYALMMGLGLVLLVRALRGRTGCGHDHGLPGHGHACDHHDHRHDHHHHHDHAHEEKRERRALGLLALAVGCRPCSGAVLVLLFALANGIVPAGLAAVVAMAVGVFLTTSAAGLIGMGARKAVQATLGARTGAIALVERGLSLSGALLITLAGGLLFLSSLSRF